METVLAEGVASEGDEPKEFVPFIDKLIIMFITYCTTCIGTSAWIALFLYAHGTDEPSFRAVFPITCIMLSIYTCIIWFGLVAFIFFPLYLLFAPPKKAWKAFLVGMIVGGGPLMAIFYPHNMDPIYHAELFWVVSLGTIPMGVFLGVLSGVTALWGRKSAVGIL